VTLGGNEMESGVMEDDAPIGQVRNGRWIGDESLNGGKLLPKT
jgi:hypothetical protein